MSGNSKTRRRVVDLSGAGISGYSDKNEQFLKFLASNADDTYRRPWHKLEPGVRKNRIRKFVEDEGARFQFTDLDKAAMFQVLLKALEKKQLNSKSIVTYDHEKEEILEIKGFVYHKQADGRFSFQFTERKVGTMRKKPAPPKEEPKSELPTTQ
jgi:hypothetical protein